MVELLCTINQKTELLSLPKLTRYLYGCKSFIPGHFVDNKITPQNFITTNCLLVQYKELDYNVNPIHRLIKQKSPIRWLSNHTFYHVVVLDNDVETWADYIELLDLYSENKIIFAYNFNGKEEFKFSDLNQKSEYISTAIADPNSLEYCYNTLNEFQREHGYEGSFPA